MALGGFVSLRDVNPYLAAPATASLEDLDEGCRPLIFVKVIDRKVSEIDISYTHTCMYTYTYTNIHYESH